LLVVVQAGDNTVAAAGLAAIVLQLAVKILVADHLLKAG
jgi:hypothetical protein